MSRLGIQTSSQKTCYRSNSPKKRSSGGIELCRILSPMYAVIPERIGNYNLTLEQDDKYVIGGQDEIYEEIKFYGVVLLTRITDPISNFEDDNFQKIGRFCR